MSKEYIVQQGGYEQQEGEVKTTREESVHFNGRNVLAVQRIVVGERTSAFTVVPGYIVSGKYRTEHGAGAFHCDPIENDKRAGLERKLREAGFRGQVNFWE